jgi:hypothetical protein
MQADAEPGLTALQWDDRPARLSTALTYRRPTSSPFDVAAGSVSHRPRR